jgi:hypothetical protein
VKMVRRMRVRAHGGKSVTVIMMVPDFLSLSPIAHWPCLCLDVANLRFHR